MPGRCPHCQAELPGPEQVRGRFCANCGGRIEGWGGLLPRVVSGPDGGHDPATAVPLALPSSVERTRPVAVSAHLLDQTTSEQDEESARPTLEMPSVGHEVRAAAPDGRVHTSPTGHVLPPALVTALVQAGEEHGEVRAMGNPIGEAIPHIVSDERTDFIPAQRPPRASQLLQVTLLVVVCGVVATIAGLGAYRAILRAAGPQEASPPSPRVAAPSAPRPERSAAARRAGPAASGARRTRDLVVNIGPSLAPGRGTRDVEAQPRRPVSQGAPTRAALEGPAAAAAPAREEAAAPATTALDAARAPAEAPRRPEVSEEEAEAIAANIEFVASTHHAQVRACHERAFKVASEGGSGGRVELSFSLTEDGRAVGVKTVSNTTGSDPLARCLEQRLGEWRFPRGPVGSAGGVFQFPFVFMAASSPPASARAGAH